jgi:ATPase family protein associated with various cellular activities (AAA)
MRRPKSLNPPLIVRLLIEAPRWTRALELVAREHKRLMPKDALVTGDIVARIATFGWDARRSFCNGTAERLGSGGVWPEGIENLALGWWMLGEDPAQSIPGIEGIIEGIENAVHDWRISTPVTPANESLHKAVDVGIEHWKLVATGQQKSEDVFHHIPRTFSVSSSRAGALEELRTASAGLIERYASRRVPPVVMHDHDDEYAEEAEVFGRVVLPEGREGMHKAYAAMVGDMVPYHLAPDLTVARATLRAEFPHAIGAVDLLLSGLAEGKPVLLRPTLLLGDPGGGKSRLARRFAEVLGLPMAKFDGSGSSDHSFSGSPKMWSNTQACFPFKLVQRRNVCNPMVFIDECDKATNGSVNGSLPDALVAFLETETSARHPDPSLDVEIDLSAVNYVLTANDAAELPEPLMDRVRVVKVPLPTLAHLAPLSLSIMRDLAKADGQGLGWIEPLSADELAVAAKVWASDLSIRTLQRIVRGTLAAREQCAMRH